jgi:hypothetical protein
MTGRNRHAEGVLDPIVIEAIGGAYRALSAEARAALATQ